MHIDEDFWMMRIPVHYLALNCLHGWGVKKLIQSAHTDATKSALKDDILILNREKDFLEYDSWNENLYLLNILFGDMYILTTFRVKWMEFIKIIICIDYTKALNLKICLIMLLAGSIAKFEMYCNTK